MPNITDFTAPSLDIRPSEIGVESAAAAGRRLGVYGNQIAASRDQEGQIVGKGIATAGTDAYNSIAHQEISAGTKHGAAIIAGLDDQWNKIVNDPNFDPNDRVAGQRFLQETVEPTLDKFQQGFLTEKGQQYAQEFSDRLRQHLFTKTAADMSTAAGRAIVSNYQDSLNSLSVAVLRDPSTLDFAIDTIRHSLDAKIGSSPTLSAEEGIRIKGELYQTGPEELVKNAAIGLVQKNPDADLNKFESRYSQYIKPGEIEQFQNAARTYKRINEGEARDAQRQQKEDQRLDFNRKVDALEASFLPQKPGDQPRLPADTFDQLRSLSLHPGAALEPGRLVSTFNRAESISQRLGKPEPVAGISHATTIDILPRLRSGEIADDKPIVDAYAAGKLTNADYSFLENEFANARTPEGQRLNANRKLFMDRFSKFIDGAMTDTGTPSLLGAQRLYDFEMDAQREEGEMRKQGKDPSAVYDPRSPNFFGRPENIARYHVSLQEAQKYQATLNAMDKTNASAPPKPGAAPLVRQNGHVYQLQSDGTYKAID